MTSHLDDSQIPGQRVSRYWCHLDSREAASRLQSETRAAGFTVHHVDSRDVASRRHSEMRPGAAGVTVPHVDSRDVRSRRQSEQRPGQLVSQYCCHLDARHCQFDLPLCVTYDLLQLFPEDATTHGVEEEVDSEARDVERANIALTRYHGNER